MANSFSDSQRTDFLRRVVNRRLEKRPELECTDISATDDHFDVHIQKKRGNGAKQIEVSREWVDDSMAAGGDAKLPEQFELLLDLYFPETFAGAAGQGM